MIRSQAKTKERNWLLVFVAMIYMALGLSLIAIVLTNVQFFGWWGLLIGFAGATPVAASITAIVKNDPSWILLDLIIPG